MRVCQFCLAVLMIAFCAAGQEREQEQDRLLLDTARRLMASESDAVKAWGAYIAARHGLEEAAPALRELLKPPPKDAPKESLFVQYAALDALIRLEAEVPPAELLQLPARFNSQVFLLLARDPAGNQAALVDLIQSSRASRACWTAVCNLLVPLKTPGLAVFLLGSLQLKVELAVLDQDNLGAGARSGITFGDAILSVPEGFPPITFYSLEEDRRSGDKLVAPGKRPVYCRSKTVQPGNRAGFGSSGGRRENNQYRMEFLAQLAGVEPDDLAFEPGRHERIRWTDAEGYISQAAFIRKKVREEFESLAGIFRSEGLLSPEEMNGLKPSIEFEVHDLRKDRSEELPPIPP